MFISNKLVVVFIILANCLVCAACNSAADTNDCTKFQNGQFWHRSEQDGSITDIYRNGKMQTEVKRGFTDTMHFAVIWMKDCRYDLQYLRGSSPVSDSMADRIKRQPIQVRILTNEKDYYIFSAEVEGSPVVLQDTIFKAN
jgi:hypothetical protein